MCGIIGYTGDREAAPLILNGLEKLEYRGYDSAGLAVCDGNHISLLKRKGRLAELRKAVGSNQIDGFTGIGHTRWATHGEPSDENSHPHLGGKLKIAVVHNGIIENYKALKEKLVRKGVVFASETDTEVIAQLAEYYYKGNLLETVVKVANLLEGSYALGIICEDEPDKLYAIKQDSPLIIGACDDGNFIASDVPAVLEHTRRVYYLEHKEIAVLDKSGVKFYNINKELISKEPVIIDWDMDSAEKAGYEHFMLKEIHEQPSVLKKTINSFIKDGEIDFGNLPDLTQFKKITVVACGSAYNAGVVGKYVIEKLAALPVETELASEFRYKDPIIDSETLVIAISQSGETADTIAAVREAKKHNVTVAGIVNVIGSTLTKEVHHTLYTVAGPEIAVATTKAFSAQLCVLYLLGIKLALERGRINKETADCLLREVVNLPEKIETILLDTEKVKQCASKHYNSKSIFFIGRNIDYAIALEGSLKLKEISYIHSEAYAGGELKHGTISLIEEGTLVVAVSCNDKLFGKLWSNAEQVISRGANVLFISNNETVAENDKLTTIPVPQISELFSPSLSVILLQLFSYYVAANKSCDIDKPRNLAKSVTVE